MSQYRSQMPPVWARSRRGNFARSLKILGVVYGLSVPECEFCLSNVRFLEAVTQDRSPKLSQSGNAVDVVTLRAPQTFSVSSMDSLLQNVSVASPTSGSSKLCHNIALRHDYSLAPLPSDALLSCPLPLLLVAGIAPNAMLQLSRGPLAGHL